MGYLRLSRRRTIAPGVRLNLSKSGPSWSLGPRGAHFTVGPHGTRRTVGIPGTGVYYTSYSGYQAHEAARRRAAPTHPARQPPAGSGSPSGMVHRDPMLPGLFERYLAQVPTDWLAEGHAGNAWLNAGKPDAAIRICSTSGRTRP